jgi:hypothetical protein
VTDSVYACPTWDYVTDAHFLKLQCRVLRAIGKLDRHTLIHEMHVAFRIPFVYDYITKLCRMQVEVIPNHRNPIVCDTGQGESMCRKYKRLKLGSSQVYDCSSDWLSFRVLKNLLQELALTEALFMYCLNVIKNCAVTKGAQCQ